MHHLSSWCDIIICRASTLFSLKVQKFSDFKFEFGTGKLDISIVWNTTSYQFNSSRMERNLEDFPNLGLPLIFLTQIFTHVSAAENVWHAKILQDVRMNKLLILPETDTREYSSVKL